MKFLYNLLNRDLSPRIKQTVYNVLTLIKDIIRLDLLKQASGMAYVTLLSIVPSLAAVFTIISFVTTHFQKTGVIRDWVRSFVVSNLAQGSGEQIIKVLEGFLDSLSLTKIGLTSFISLFITLILLLRQIEISFNKIWMVRKERNSITRFIHFWTFLTLGAFLLSIAIGLGSGFNTQQYMFWAENTLDEIPIPEGGKSGLLSLLLSWVFFTSLFKLVPNIYVPLKHALKGAFLSALLFFLARRAFGIYTELFSGHEALYGALAALPLFLMWLYICWMIILAGALLSWRLEQGFPSIESELSEEFLPFPQGSLLNHRLRSMTPFFILIKLLKKLHGQNGIGMSIKELQGELNLPRLWVSDSLGLLMNHGFAAPIRPLQSGDEDSDFYLCPYVATRTMDSLTLSEIREYLMVPTQKWLHEWQEHTGEDYAKMVSDIFSEKDKSADKTLSQIV